MDSEFQDWWEKNEIKFLKAAYSTKEIAYFAWFEVKRKEIEKMIKKNEKNNNKEWD